MTQWTGQGGQTLDTVQTLSQSNIAGGQYTCTKRNSTGSLIYGGQPVNVPQPSLPFPSPGESIFPALSR